jgi:UDP-N-acetylglucosamine 2-epimerase (non-hydrolysing)
MRVVTIFGTRPEIIRLSRVVSLLDRFCEHVIVHTGQNGDPNLSEKFFQELDIRQPDVRLGVTAKGFAEQTGQILSRIEPVLSERRPDRVLILGDTNSGLAALVAARMQIPVFHMEAGNRCYDNRVPEEINRRIIDHASAVLMPYTHRSKENLLREGIERHRIVVTGNPIFEVLEAYRSGIEQSTVLDTLNLRPHHYFLVTLHRAENVDDSDRLQQFFEGIGAVADHYDKPAIISLHPRTADRMKHSGVRPRSAGVRLLEPFGFFDFVRLEQSAKCVLSDSGTVQEECCILGVPSVTLRDVTERPETIECGSNVVSGAHPDAILAAVSLAVESAHDWICPPEYKVPHVASIVGRVVLGHDAQFERHSS